ncbi:putative quinol monooxygenase [Mixta gaviniae]|uniref:Antibiotic biosynthesis monooxygenase n=1 Tax=Mixta gaviniae TaxID=665914 RepID=A0A1X1DIE9_9GAMM|nr:putative quinol monooxygenase [Mixta gaviniae]AUX93932.1 antibiotic biosynthesis monooxygenase [Mixta gaviniae]ORM76475.1 antibiotic biosynthesis monooxygenase [Mixta gaviniae]
MSQAITIVATIIAKAGEAEAVEQALRTAEREVHGEPGCQQYQLHQDLEKPDHFVLLERWESEAHIQQHSEAAPFLRLVEAIKDRAELQVTKLKTLS